MRSRIVALGGLLVALAVVIMLLGGAIGIGTYAAPVLALAVLLPLQEEYGAKVSLPAWVAVSVISLLLNPDMESALVYAAFGWYPTVQPHLNRLPGKLLPLLAKLGIYAAVILVLYQLLLRFLGLTADLLEATRMFNLILFCVGLLVFLLTDRMLDLFRRIWHTRFRHRFFH